MKLSLNAISIRSKVLTGFLVTAVLAGLTGVVGVVTSSDVGSSGNRVGADLAPLGDAAMEIKLSSTYAHLLFEEIMAGDEGEDIAEVFALLDESLFYANAILDGGSHDEGVFRATDNPEVRLKTEEVRDLITAFIDSARMRYQLRGQDSGAGSEADESFDLAFEALIARADEARELIHDEMDLGLAALDSAQSRALYLSVGATVVAFALAGLLALVIGANVSRRLLRLSRDMERLASGDTSVETGFSAHGDEIGTMARSVEVFRDNAIENARLTAAKAEEQAASEARARELQARCSAFDQEASTILQVVSTRSGEMRAAAESMQSTAERTAGMSNAVASAVAEASSNVQGAASGAEELSASIAEILRQISESSENAAAAVARTEDVSARMKGLDDAAQKIGAVIGLINDIAAQTNLLALNATIEAARAGEAGKGFAVVASEVKSLATQTAKATDEIAIQIGGMQTATGDAVSAIDGIRQMIGKISETATATAGAVEQQDAATREIAQGIQQAAVGTQEVSANIEGVHSATSETGDAASNVLSSAQQMSEESGHLTDAVRRFIDEVKAA